MGLEQSEMPFVRVHGEKREGLRPVGFAIVLDGHGGLGNDRKALYDAYPDEVQWVYQVFKEETGVDVASISFDAPEEILNRTENYQLAQGAYSRGAVGVLFKENPRLFGRAPKMLMAQSMGLNTNLELAGYTGQSGSKESIAKFARILHERGRIMQEIEDQTPGGMLRVVVSRKGNGSMADKIRLKDLFVDFAHEENLHTGIEVNERQVILSGHSSDIELVRSRLEGLSQFGIFGTVSKIKGAFHSPLMEPAIAEFKPFLEKTLEDPTNPIPILSNTSDPMKVLTSRDEIIQEVGEDLFVKPVRGPAMVDFRSKQSYAGTYFVGERKAMAEAIDGDPRFTLPLKINAKKAAGATAGVLGTAAVIGYAVYKHHANKAVNDDK